MLWSGRFPGLFFRLIYYFFKEVIQFIAAGHFFGRLGASRCVFFGLFSRQFGWSRLGFLSVIKTQSIKGDAVIFFRLFIFHRGGSRIPAGCIIHALANHIRVFPVGLIQIVKGIRIAKPLSGHFPLSFQKSLATGFIPRQGIENIVHGVIIFIEMAPAGLAEPLFLLAPVRFFSFGTSVLLLPNQMADDDHDQVRSGCHQKHPGRYAEGHQVVDDDDGEIRQQDEESRGDDALGRLGQVTQGHDQYLYSNKKQ